MAEETYRYRAFISYRHVDRDRNWARWLIEKLETFRTPRALVHNGAPLRIGQLFRDDDEIPASSDLSHQIEDALRASQFLIVVCSRDTPQSRWVRHEIEFFRSIGRGSRIFALLVDGEPDEAFPPELLRVPEERTAPDGTKSIEMVAAEPIAADVRHRDDERRKVTERRAFLRIAAGLLGVNFDDLARREHQRRMRQQRFWGSVAAVLVLGVSAGGYEYWDYNRIKLHYYANFGTRWSIPFGIGEMSATQASRRGYSYAIYTQRGRTIEMLRESGSHGPMPLQGDGLDAEAWDAGAAEWRISYEGDHVSSITLLGSSGNAIRTESYRFLDDGHSAVVTFLNSQGGAKPLSAGESELAATFESEGPSADRSQIGQHRLEYSADGLNIRRIFQTPWGLPAQDANGSFARAYTYSATGQIESIRGLDKNGNTLSDASGIAEIRHRYSPSGDLVFAQWRDPNGALIRNPLGYAEQRIVRDDVGNEFRDDYLGEDGRPILQAGGYARMETKRDPHGNAVQVDFAGTDGRPIPLKDSEFARVTYKFDDAGDKTEESYFGTGGKPVLRTDGGYARLSWRYDRYHNLIEETFYGVTGQPVRTGSGYARQTWKWDGRGNASEEDYFDPHGNLVLNNRYGYARAVWTYDMGGNPIEARYLGSDDRPILRRDEGFARATTRYDGRGNVVETKYFGIDGKPILRSDVGYAREIIQYDERGNVVERKDFGVDDRPIVRKDFGYAGLIARYDDRGDWLGTDYLGTDGKPVLRRDYGYASIALKYDERGDPIEADFYGADGKLVTSTESGCARMTMTYNARGMLVKTLKFGVRGERVF